jgi:hypothetical protein
MSVTHGSTFLSRSGGEETIARFVYESGHPNPAGKIIDAFLAQIAGFVAGMHIARAAARFIYGCAFNRINLAIWETLAV